MSQYVVHFTKDYGGQTAYQNILSILRSQRIEGRAAFGIGRQRAPDPGTQLAVCFSEVPLHLLKRLSTKYSNYGLVFRKDLLIANRGNPILYAYQTHPIVKAVRQLMAASRDDPSAPIWALTAFIDAPGRYRHRDYLFESEREWRVLRDFVFFDDDVSALIIPERFHEKAKEFFVKRSEMWPLQPAYHERKYVDASWSLARLKAAGMS